MKVSAGKRGTSQGLLKVHPAYSWAPVRTDQMFDFP